MLQYILTTIISQNLEFYDLPPSIQIWLIETNSAIAWSSQGANGGGDNLFLGLGVWTVTPSDPDNAGARALKLTRIYERRRQAGGGVVLIAGVVPVAVNEAVVRAGAGPVPCDQVWLSAKSRNSAA